MITEDYCSCELSQLLKGKGFDIETITYYYCTSEYTKSKIYKSPNNTNWNNNEYYYSAPTHQMAMKWLRDIYSISIEPYCYEYGWYCGFSQLPKGITIYTSQESKEYGTYEEVVEAACTYALKNLI